MARPKRFKRVITGFNVGSGIGVDSTLVATDAHHCQRLLALIDSKDVFTAPAALEMPDRVIDSVKEVRSMATSIEGLVDGEETYEEVHNIARACRQFMRDYDISMSTEVLEAALKALRAQVGESLSVLVRLLSLRTTSDFDLSPYEARGTQILEVWLNRR